MSKYITIMRIDHWFKQIFVLPGFFLALLVIKKFNYIYLFELIVYLLSICLMASSNYVMNEYVDARFDKFHPLKKKRAIPTKGISFKNIIIFYLILVSLSLLIPIFYKNNTFLVMLIIFLVSGILYNLKPIRLKDRKYLDVISESLNNPIRLLLGFTIVSEQVSLIPSSIFLTYWFSGAFLMNSKRLAEFNFLKKISIIRNYRPSLAKYKQPGELEAISFFYALLAISFLTVFIIKYKIEFIIFIFGLIILFFYYFKMSLEKNSIAQTPEKLFKNNKIILLVLLNIILFLICFFYKIEIISLLLNPNEINFNHSF